MYLVGNSLLQPHLLKLHLSYMINIKTVLCGLFISCGDIYSHKVYTKLVKFSLTKIWNQQICAIVIYQ